MNENREPYQYPPGITYGQNIPEKELRERREANEFRFQAYLTTLISLEMLRQSKEDRVSDAAHAKLPYLNPKEHPDRNDFGGEYEKAAQGLLAAEPLSIYEMRQNLKKLLREYAISFATAFIKGADPTPWAGCAGPVPTNRGELLQIIAGLYALDQDRTEWGFECLDEPSSFNLRQLLEEFLADTEELISLRGFVKEQMPGATNGEIRKHQDAFESWLRDNNKYEPDHRPGGKKTNLFHRSKLFPLWKEWNEK